MFGWLFDVLLGFDKPFNQAPSLHIVLLIVLWVKFAQYLHGVWRGVLHVWALLIGVSVLTTFQHHFVDIPTGLLAGWLCVWLWPEQGTPPSWAWHTARDARRWRLAALYLLGAAVLLVPVVLLRGAALWLLWPVTSLLLVALAYAGLGTAVFQKRADGRLTMAARWLLAPYLGAAWINSRLWTRRAPQPVPVLDGVWLGRIPNGALPPPLGGRGGCLRRAVLSRAGRRVCQRADAGPGGPLHRNSCAKRPRPFERLHGPRTVAWVCCALGLFAQRPPAVATCCCAVGRVPMWARGGGGGHGDFVLIWSSMPPALRRQVRPVAAAEYWQRDGLRRYLIDAVFNGVLVEREAGHRQQDPLQALRDAVDEDCSLILFRKVPATWAMSRCCRSRAASITWHGNGRSWNSCRCGSTT